MTAAARRQQVRPELLARLESDLASAIDMVRAAEEPIEVTVSMTLKVSLDPEGRPAIELTSKSSETRKFRWLVDGAPTLPGLG